MYEQENKRLLRWLAGKSPDMRHYVAMNLNWDFAEPTLEWIVTRSDCHLATAVEMFWLSDATDLLGFSNRDAAGEHSDLWAFDFISGIVLRATNNFYTRNLISYNMQEKKTDQIKEFEDAERNYHPKGLPWIAPASFRIRHQMLNIDTKTIESGFWSKTLDSLMKDLGTSWGV